MFSEFEPTWVPVLLENSGEPLPPSPRFVDRRPTAGRLFGDRQRSRHERGSGGREYSNQKSLIGETRRRERKRILYRAGRLHPDQ